MLKKVIHTELDLVIAYRFDLIKSQLGLKNDGEVIRFLISDFFNRKIKREYERNKILAKKEYDNEIGSMLTEFIDKYGDQWRRLGEEK
ncbi:MAG: hypothetical protein K9W44_04155 [Candidatus Lokiarchaeota archaeon]|nr:hypothetical protein [Candidatus Harpocratesius repetitus]